MFDLSPYKNRYCFSGTVTDALWAVGSNEGFEIDAQIAFVKRMGLLPSHTFLDFGCGCLRGSAKILDYLDDGNFHGADISEGLLSAIPKRLELLGINKKPVIHLVNDYELWELIKEKFDFILSVSILTHLMPEAIDPLFNGISQILKDNGAWYFTLYPTNSDIHEGDIEYAKFNKGWLIERGKANGLLISDIDGDYENPSPISNYIERVNTSEIAQWVMKAVLRK